MFTCTIALSGASLLIVFEPIPLLSNAIAILHTPRDSLLFKVLTASEQDCSITKRVGIGNATPTSGNSVLAGFQVTILARRKGF